MISAASGSGVADIRDWLAEIVPQGPWLYPEDQITDAPERHWAAEVTREKLYARLHDELPYASTVETTDWKTLKDGSIRIEQTVYVERESQKEDHARRRRCDGQGDLHDGAQGIAGRARREGAPLHLREGAR